MRSGEWLELHGVVVEGYGVASGTAADSPYPRGSIELQVPFFKDCGLDLTRFHRGTLNVSIAPLRASMVNPRFTFRSILWSPSHEPEDFSFAPCQIAHAEAWHAGFVYYPHPETKPRHHHDPSILEIITTYLTGVAYGDAIDLLIGAREFTVTR